MPKTQNPFDQMDTVSVIMPCFNHGSFVIESVEAVLNQSVQDLELIVVDDCSSDDSHRILRRLADKDSRVKVVSHEYNRGASSSRNDGMRLANGRFIAFCDADDVWERDKLATQIAVLTAYPEYGITYSDAAIIDEHGTMLGPRFSDSFRLPRAPSGNLFVDLCERNFINMQTVMMRRECISQGAHFDERIRWVEDWWFWIQLSRQSSFIYLPQPLARYRVHSSSTARTKRRGYHLNRFKVFRRVLQLGQELSPIQKTKILYHMGCSLQNSGRFQMAHRVFRQACKSGVRHRASLADCARPLVRMFWPENWQQACG